MKQKIIEAVMVTLPEDLGDILPDKLLETIEFLLQENLNIRPYELVLDFLQSPDFLRYMPIGYLEQFHEIFYELHAAIENKLDELKVKNNDVYTTS